MVVKVLPWAVPVLVGSIPEQGAHRDIEASASERGAIAAIAGLNELQRLTASFDLAHLGKRQVRVTGKVFARVGQTCVVTLDPLVSDIEEAVDITFSPEAGEIIPATSASNDEALDIDPPEPLVGGEIDLGKLAIEFLIVGIDPYPRKPDVVFQPALTPEDPADHPFAALAALKEPDDKKKSSKPKDK
jgi:hypothetical protein